MSRDVVCGSTPEAFDSLPWRDREGSAPVSNTKKNGRSGIPNGLVVEGCFW